MVQRKRFEGVKERMCGAKAVCILPASFFAWAFINDYHFAEKEQDHEKYRNGQLLDSQSPNVRFLQTHVATGAHLVDPFCVTLQAIRTISPLDERYVDYEKTDAARSVQLDFVWLLPFTVYICRSKLSLRYLKSQKIKEPVKKLSLERYFWFYGTARCLLCFLSDSLWLNPEHKQLQIYIHLWFFEHDFSIMLFPDWMWDDMPHSDCTVSFIYGNPRFPPLRVIRVISLKTDLRVP